MKKLSPCLLLIISLSLTLSYGLPILGGFQLVDAAVAQVDNQIQGLINAGLEKITQDGGLSDNYYLSAINQIAQQTQDDVTNYRFNCNFQNSQGQTITALFNASYEYSTATQTVQNFEYNVFTYTLSETVSNTFVQITTESIQSSSFIQSIVQYGSSQIIQRALSAGKISTENFQISNINSVSSQVVDSAVFYNCSVDLEDSEGSTLTALYTVYYQALLNITYIIDFSYQVSSSQEQVTDLVQIVAPVQSQYTSISVSTVQNSETIQSALNFGAQQVVQIGVSDNNLSSTQFSISEIVKAYSQIIANGIFYKFNCQIQVQSSQTISATFEVYYQTSTGQTNLTSYDYQVSSTTTTSTNLTYVTPVIPINGNFTKCTETQIRNEQDIQSALSYGANQVAIIGIQQGDIPSTSFSLFQITSVYQQTTVVGVSYQYEVLLSNKNGVILATNFTVLAQSSSVFVLSSYNYQVYLNSLGTSVTTVNTNTSTSTTVSTSITVNVTITTSVTIGVVTYPTNSTSSSNTVKNPGSGWVLLTEQEIKNSVVQSCIRYGMNDILQIGIQLKSFPYSIWSLTEVIAVYQKTQNWGQFYQITLHLTSASGLRVDTTFTLSYNIATLLIRLNSYYYNVGAFITGKTVASTSGLNNTTPAPTNTSNLPFSNSNDGLEYASNGYYRIPIHWVDESSEIQNCINFGAPAVVQIGINQKKIPVSNYIVYKVVWVQRNIGSRGVYYAIRLYLTNIDNVDLVATFTIFINKSNNNLSLYTYAYTVDNVRTTWYTPGGTTNSTGSTNTTTVTNVTSLVTTASWTALPALQIDNNQEVQDAIKYATSVLVQISIQSNSAPSAVYNISTINGVSQKTTQNGVFYSCDVVLTSSTNVQIITNFTVYYERSSESYNLTTYQYQVNSAQNTVGQEVGLINSGYIQVNISEVTSNSQISSCLNYGIRQIIQSYQSYSVSQINSCYSQVINSAYYYMFDVNLTSESNSNTIIQVNYIVYFRADINQQVVTAYSINTINITSSSSSSSTSASSSSSSSSEITYTEESDTSDSDYETLVNVGSNKCIDELYSKNVIVSTDFSVSQIRKVFTSSSSSSLYYSFEVTLRNIAGISLDVTLNMRRSQSISLSESTLVSYFVQGTSADQSNALVSDYSESETSQSRTSSCQKISNTQIQSGTQVKEAIDYGVQEIISKVTQNTQISSDFVIDQTESVYQEIASSSSYKAKLVLRNSQGRRVKCHYSVKYSSSTSIKQVTSYNYIIY